MSAMPDGYVVITSIESSEAASSLAKDLVVNRYAACVSLIPQVASVYIWKEELEQSTESLLLIKVSSAGLESLLEYLNQQHPYECPEVIAVPAEKISKKYLSWMCGLDKTIDQEATDSE